MYRVEGLEAGEQLRQGITVRRILSLRRVFRALGLLLCLGAALGVLAGRVLAAEGRAELPAGLPSEIDPEELLEGVVDPQAGLPPELEGEIGAYDGAVEGFGSRVLGLLGSTLGQIKELGLREGLHSLGLILASALLCSLLEQSDSGRGAVPLVGALSIAGACTRPLGAMIRLGTETIAQLHRYTELLIPSMGTLLVCSGTPSAAASSSLGLLLLELLLSAVDGLLVPLLYLMLVLSVAESALGVEQLGQLRDFVKWLSVTGVKLLLWGYSGIMSLTGLAAGAADAQKLRTLRSAVSGMVPVVGNLVSEASASLMGAASLLRTAAGLYGMLAVLGICLSPFFRIGLQYLLLKLAGALCGLFGKGSQSPLLQNLSQIMGLVLALTGIACLLCLMMLVLCIRTVNV